MFNSEVWKYIVQRKILFTVVVIITVLTPVAYKVIDSYTKVVIARMDKQQPSTSPNIKKNNDVVNMAGRINNKNEEKQIAKLAK